MSLSLTLACLWVLAGAVTAMLPMRLQMLPGLALLLLSLPLAAFIGLQHGWLLSALMIAATLSMFRKPLAYLVRRAFGRGGEA